MILDKRFFKEKPKKSRFKSHENKFSHQTLQAKQRFNDQTSVRRISLVRCRVLSCRIAIYKMPAVAPVLHLL